MNKIPGVAIDLVDKVSFAAEVAANNEAAKAARASELSSLQALTEANSLARQAQLSQMQAEAEASQAERLAEIAGKQSELAEKAGSGTSFGDIPAWDGNVNKVGSVGSVKNVEGEVNLSDEDLKLYRDLAERKYMANVELQTLAPQISVSIPESAAKNLTAQDIADKLKTILIQQSASHTAVSHG